MDFGVNSVGFNNKSDMLLLSHYEYCQDTDTADSTFSVCSAVDMSIQKKQEKHDDTSAVTVCVSSGDVTLTACPCGRTLAGSEEDMLM